MQNDYLQRRERRAVRMRTMNSHVHDLRRTDTFQSPEEWMYWPNWVIAGLKLDLASVKLARSCKWFETKVIPFDSMLERLAIPPYGQFYVYTPSNLWSERTRRRIQTRKIGFSTFQRQTHGDERLMFFARLFRWWIANRIRFHECAVCARQIQEFYRVSKRKTKGFQFRSHPIRIVSSRISPIPFIRIDAAHNQLVLSIFSAHIGSWSLCARNPEQTHTHWINMQNARTSPHTIRLHSPPLNRIKWMMST